MKNARAQCRHPLIPFAAVAAVALVWEKRPHAELHRVWPASRRRPARSAGEVSSLPSPTDNGTRSLGLIQEAQRSWKVKSSSPIPPLLTRMQVSWAAWEVEWEFLSLRRFQGWLVRTGAILGLAEL